VTVPGPAPAERSDEDLIAEWKATGDEAAASALVRRHVGPVARFLAGAGGGDDTEDVVQEAFFRAFRKIDSWRAGASFRTWVMTIGLNALKDLRRRTKRHTTLTLEDRDAPDERRDPAGEAVVNDQLARLGPAVQRLPSMQRHVFLLRAQQELSYQEIAVALGTSEGAARVHYHHAVKRLKQAMEGEGHA
jgi:RNA polymerase sigma-70 factor (ECF subfamily)